MQHAALPLPSFLSRLLRASALSACLLTIGALGNPAWANSYLEVQQLAASGQTAEALAKADSYIQQNPRDPQMRFIRGVLLSDQGKATEATQVFVQLTRDYPELPEPYNNLAAIYAGQGQYDKAREALETALRLNPNYVTAHENLGDIYARLAAQQYAKATQFASASPAAQVKLNHVRQLFEAIVQQQKGDEPVSPKASANPGAEAATAHSRSPGNPEAP